MLTLKTIEGDIGIYNLYGVIYHKGRDVEEGHYIADVLQEE